MSKPQSLREQEASTLFAFINWFSSIEMTVIVLLCVFLFVLYLLERFECIRIRTFFREREFQLRPQVFQKALPSSDRKVTMGCSECMTPRFFPDLAKNTQSVETIPDSDQENEKPFGEVFKGEQNRKIKSRILYEMEQNSKGDNV